MRLLLLLCAVPTSASFGLVPTPLNSAPAAASTATPIRAADGDDDGGGVPNYGSDLKALLPTPKKRTLKLDKFGRRVHDLTDDGTTNYARERGVGKPAVEASAAEVAAALAAEDPAPAYDPAPMVSDADATLAQLASLGGGGEDDEAPGVASLPKILNEDAKKSAKELAADASSGDFSRPVGASADLKALLPTQKMRFMKLDKFGRRIQRMEDDGTVNMQKEPTRQQEAPRSYSRGTREGFGSDSATVVPALGPPLSEILGKGKDESRNNDAALEPGGNSAALKELLPQQKMRFMKLDKFGRRVQAMEDDGTVHHKKEPSIEKSEGEELAMVDLDSASSLGASNYGSLRDLMPTKRAVWTKLDFKGASVADDRRFKSTTQSGGDVGGDVGGEFKSEGGGGSLKELLPKRATWTKLDFKGASVPDERRTATAARTAESGGEDGGGDEDGFNEGEYSNLTTLLPERTITWKRDQVLSSGSSPTVGEERERRVTNLTTLLPARTITWKKNRVLSSGSSPTAGENVRGMREERRRAMKEEVIASASASDDDDEGTKAYTNLKDLLPGKKVTWRKTSF